MDERIKDTDPFHRFFELISREGHEYKVAEKAFISCIRSMHTDNITIVYYLMLSWIISGRHGMSFLLEWFCIVDFPYRKPREGRTV
jgi:hypothetical protein